MNQIALKRKNSQHVHVPLKHLAFACSSQDFTTLLFGSVEGQFAVDWAENACQLEVPEMCTGITH